MVVVAVVEKANDGAKWEGEEAEEGVNEVLGCFNCNNLVVLFVNQDFEGNGFWVFLLLLLGSHGTLQNTKKKKKKMV